MMPKTLALIAVLSLTMPLLSMAASAPKSSPSLIRTSPLLTNYSFFEGDPFQVFFSI